jgi:lipopolysaccharide/colanic/teichoic acid biosynthesis glycosyltransferase
VIKRVMDMILSGIALIILLPFIPPLMLLLRLSGEGEIFYIQPRVGKNGKIFGLIKFATMLKDSPKLHGGDLTSANDPRILPIGKFLRKTKINELPQLWNVLKGDMSLVGPRPFTPSTFKLYPEEMQREILTLKPGLTGIGSIVFRDEEGIIAKSNKPDLLYYCEDILPYKGKLETWYKLNQGLRLDVILIFLTAWVIIFPRSKYYEKLLKGLPEKPKNLLID